MSNVLSRSSLLLVGALGALSACTDPVPPPPVLTVTSPERGLVQGDAAQVVVKGSALPGPTGDPVAKVTVNGVAATLAPDGSFTATVDVSSGATLLETVAIGSQGGKTTDARAVEAGQLRPVGTSIDHAVTATLSADAFAKLSAAAGPIIRGTDFNALLAPLQPIARFGDDIANVQLTITNVTLGDVKLSLIPTEGGLEFSAELDHLAFAALAHYDGALVPEGTTNVGATADQVTIAGTLMVTPNGANGFTTRIASPSVRTVALKLDASGLVGDILGLVQDNLASTVQSLVTSSAEGALEPLINNALGALAGPQQLVVLGHKVELVASPAAITFTGAGALVSMNIGARIEGSESSPGYIFTPNGTPALQPGNGVQLALADDLMNEMLAEIHALGVLDLKLPLDVGVFDEADIKMTLPPMISANTADGSLRLVLGDMIASFTDHGQPVVSAAINARIDLAILPGNNPQQLALQFGEVHFYVNLLDGTGGESGGGELNGPASAAIGVQLQSMSKFLLDLPLPSVEGVSFDSLTLHSDSGYVVVAGQVH